MHLKLISYSTQDSKSQVLVSEIWVRQVRETTDSSCFMYLIFIDCKSNMRDLSFVVIVYRQVS